MPGQQLPTNGCATRGIHGRSLNPRHVWAHIQSRQQSAVPKCGGKLLQLHFTSNKIITWRIWIILVIRSPGAVRSWITIELAWFAKHLYGEDVIGREEVISY